MWILGSTYTETYLRVKITSFFTPGYSWHWITGCFASETKFLTKIKPMPTWHEFYRRFNCKMYANVICMYNKKKIFFYRNAT